MAVWTPASLGYGPAYLLDGLVKQDHEDPEWKMFVGDAQHLEPRLHHDFVVQRPDVGRDDHSMRHDRSIAPNHERQPYGSTSYSSPQTIQQNGSFVDHFEPPSYASTSYSSSQTEGFSTPSSTPAPDHLDEAFSPGIDEDASGSAFIPNDAAAQQSAVRHERLPLAYAADSQNPSSLRDPLSTTLQSSIASEQARFVTQPPGFAYNAPALTPWFGNVHDIAQGPHEYVSTSLNRNALDEASLETQFHSFQPFRGLDDAHDLGSSPAGPDQHMAFLSSEQLRLQAIPHQQSNLLAQQLLDSSVNIGAQFGSPGGTALPDGRNIASPNDFGVEDTLNDWQIVSPYTQSHAFHDITTSSVIGAEHASAPSPEITIQPPASSAMNRRTRVRVPSEPNPNTSRPSQFRVNKGGRKKGTNLPQAVKVKANQMRDCAACWWCRLQRISCDRPEGAPCSKCIIRAPLGTSNFFGCDRTKLPDLVHDFLPHSATEMHQIETVKATIMRDVDGFLDRGIDVSLSCGYGPPLIWKLYEFRPQNAALLEQWQYVQDKRTGCTTRVPKWSPPLGVRQFDELNDAKFESHLTRLLHPNELMHFGRSFYKEERRRDKAMFQAKLLQHMCDLHTNSGDGELKTLLTEILRMLLVTYIMAHVLTIERDTVHSVMRSLQRAKPPSNVRGMQHISPRLANQQLKCYFSRIRAKMYEQLLKQFQAILIKFLPGAKESTWTQSFCLMLGFAMVLEELQHTLFIQADVSATRGTASHAQANQQCADACHRIDERFALLIGIYRCKYRDKTWTGLGSFGPGTPRLEDPASDNFARRVRHLLDQRVDHLKNRASVTYAPDSQQFYTTRLTARFLLAFRDLPQM